MFGKKTKQNFRIIAVIEELDDVSKMLKEYFDEYGYKAGIISRLEVNIPYEIAILQIDPNSLVNLKDFKLESIVLNLKNPLIYKNDIIKFAKKLDKAGSIIGDIKALVKLEKRIPNNILIANVDFTSSEENRSISSYKYIGFYAQTLTKSLYKFTDKEKDTDKIWKVNNKYAYKMEALLFAVVNSIGLIS